MRSRGGADAVGAEQESAVLIGRLLRNGRLSRGLTLEEVERAIRVGARQILAVEEGRFADLPPQPYARGLVSAYAIYLGLEIEELLRGCGQILAGEGSGPYTSVFRYPARKQFVWREWAVPFALAAIVVSIVGARAVLAPAPPALGIPVAPAVVVARPVQQGAAPAAAPAASNQPAAAPVTSPGVRIVLRSEGTTWAEAIADGGEQRRYELGPGENLAITARERLALTLGDAGVIRLSVNERELGFIGDKGETKPGLSFTAAKPAPSAVPAVAGD